MRKNNPPSGQTKGPRSSEGKKAGPRPPARNGPQPGPAEGRAAKISPKGAKSSGSSPRNGNTVLLYGYHAVREALRAGQRPCIALFATQAAAEKLAPDIAKAGIASRLASMPELDARLPSGSVHQGVLLETRAIEAIDLTDIETKSGIVLVLDQVTDPHNVGAILRTAAAYGVDALVTTERHAPEMSGVLAKAASGGLEHVPIASVTNLARALEQLGRMGFLRVGLDSEGPQSLGDMPLSRPVALVLGAEGKGLRRLSRENCDVLARLDMPGAIKSLNVSNACAVALAMVHCSLKS